MHACADPSPSQHTLSLIAAIGERYTSQRAAFSSLYPPAELHLRNAASRTDGYWAFVAKKEEPPPGLTYGEFPLGFFSLLLEQALAAGGKSAEDSVLADLGSGAGRLVLWAAATQAWKLCKGVELLPSLHAAALAKLEQAEGQAGLLLAPVELAEASWDDTSLNLADVDLAFVYTTALPADEQGATLAPPPPLPSALLHSPRAPFSPLHSPPQSAPVSLFLSFPSHPRARLACPASPSQIMIAWACTNRPSSPPSRQVCSSLSPDRSRLSSGAAAWYVQPTIRWARASSCCGRSMGPTMARAG